MIRLKILVAALAILFMTAACSDDSTSNENGVGDGADAGESLDTEGGSAPDSEGGGDGDPDDDTGEDDPDDDTGGDDPDDDAGGDDPDPHEDYDPDQWTCTSEYQRVCDDTCVNTKIDPDHCGECDNACDDGTACSGGECMDSCLDSQTICDRQCAELDNDNNHCGECGNACDDGEGCVDGSCVNALTFETPTWCEGGGAPIDFDLDEDDRCAGDVAESTFRWAMCACDEATFPGGGGFTTDAFDSSLGPYIPGILGGSVGVNNDMRVNGFLNIGGSVWVGDTSDLDLAGGGAKSIAVDLHVDGNVNVNSGSVGNNARVGATLAGPLAIHDTLTIPDENLITGNASYATLIEAPVSFPPPCNCEEDDLVPVNALVADREFNNDNALIGLESDAMMDSSYQRLDLPCGNYYLDGVSGGGDVVIVAHGRTALFIDGDIDPSHITMLASPEAELDVFVNGSINAGGLIFGSPDYPAVTRLYVGGDADNRLQITSNVRIGGFIYSYPGRIQIMDDVEIYGGLFGNQVHLTQPLTIHYDRQVQRSGDICEVPDDDPDDDPTDPDAGFPDAGDDPDAGEEPIPVPVCVSLDGQCDVDGDCCTPLICDQGTCSTAPCRPTLDPCVYHSDCCSGICARDSGETEGVCISG